MKVKFQTEELKKLLSQLGAVVSKKASVPVYGFVRLFAVQQRGEGLQPTFAVGIAGKDIDAALVRYFTKAEADGPVDVLLPFGKLVEIIANVSVAESTIEAADENKATFKAGKYKAELKTHPLANWPPDIERPEKAIAQIELPAFKDQIGAVEFAVPANDGKFVVSVAKVESDGFTVKLVATDGMRLALAEVPKDAGVWSLTIPKPALELIKKLDGGAQVTISEAEAGFFFDTELETLTVSRSHGEFPNYANVLPKSFKTAIAVDKAVLLESVKRVRALAESEKPVIVFTAAENGTALNLAAGSNESGSDGSVFRNNAEDEIDAKIEGPAQQISLNAELLQPFLDKATGSVTVQLTTATGVADFRANDGKYRFLLMPVAPAKA
jgi:DNA polymerase-3 subunit beta